MSSATSVQHLYATEGLLFRTPPEHLQCPEIGQLLGDIRGRQTAAGWVEFRVNYILEQCDVEFMTMVFFSENAFWISAIERVARRWLEVIPPYHFIRLVKAILTARFNYIAVYGLRLPDSDVACSANILLFSFLLHRGAHQMVFEAPDVSVAEWDRDVIEDHIDSTRAYKVQRWTRIHDYALLYDLSDPIVFNEIVNFIRARGPPTRTLQSLQEEYETWWG
ncbi:hypothetical protein N0V84_009124 [Fusarium piperis]|uniref:Uncharacterized protein n=1 Tax=Fusarium piperis TaxID=1435070 RepID=A0A9W8W6W6_9HYPO|nr:hypothetical protein N0V84_009124 [Fusarium piperis]